MKIARHRDEGRERWGVVNEQAGTIRPFRDAFRDWAADLTAAKKMPEFAGDPIPLPSVQLLAPRPDRGEVIWVGLNYPAWPRPVESEPPIFFKPKSAVIGPEETILFPQLLKAQTQCYFCYEIELVAIIGSHEMRDIECGSRDVLGYTVGLSGCLRHVRVGAVGIDLVALRCGKRTSALGPWITTRDELETGGNLSLDLTTRVNGQVTQSFNTAEMIWGIDKLLYEVGHRLHLSGGDVIYTGTGGYVGVPDGVFQPGDNIEAEIAGIGVLKSSIEKNDPYAVHPSQRWGGEGRVPGIYPSPEWRRA
jgi:2-keto-4-pentenoate hydratase/2-oxohepta-3-ene-1,7-dioic acid hydratase in catechol pathway